MCVFFKLWLIPFICGLPGSLSDKTITSSGVGGLSFFISLKEEKNMSCEFDKN